MQQMLAQKISDILLKLDNKKFISKLLIKLLTGVRKILIKLNDSVLIKYELEGRTIFLPLRHDLPFVKKAHPFYDLNIGRIAKYLLEKYPLLKAIDIGANVGDTAIIIKSNADIPLLCIEGEPFYFNLLTKNTSNLKNIFYEKCLVGDPADKKLYLISYKGSATLSSTESNTTSIFRNLTSILKDHREIDIVKYIKIDTDGFDCKIIRGNVDFIKEHKPVIFFEYDPHFLSINKDDGISVFELLTSLGYKTAILYNNTGEFLISLDISNLKALRQLHLFYSGRNTEMYLDICVFNNDDSDIAEKIIGYEFEYFSKNILSPN